MMRRLTIGYLLLIIGLTVVHARPSDNEISDESSSEGSDEDDGKEDEDKAPEENQGVVLEKDGEETLVEGDILSKKKKYRSGADSVGNPWQGGILYYDDSGLSGLHGNNITLAAEEITKATGNCITIKKRRFERNYVKMTANHGCSSHLGMQGGPQEMSLGRGCSQIGTIIHEFLHALGIYHEHTRFDRDDYVEVQWKNILRDRSENFKLNPDVEYYGIPYCYGSIMHYKMNAFGIPEGDNSKTTLEPKKRTSAKLGQRERLAPCDIQLLKKKYKCDKGGLTTPTSDPNRRSTTSRYTSRYSSKSGYSGSRSSGVIRKTVGK